MAGKCQNKNWFLDHENCAKNGKIIMSGKMSKQKLCDSMWNKNGREQYEQKLVCYSTWNFTGNDKIKMGEKTSKQKIVLENAKTTMGGKKRK